MTFEQEQQAADELRDHLVARFKLSSPSELVCPREKSFMTPCIARDGRLALADDGDCVFCRAVPSQLLAAERSR